MSAALGEATRVRSIAHNAIRYPAGVIPWLAHWERRLIGRLHDLESVQAAARDGGSVLATVIPVLADELRVLLDDPKRGAFGLMIARDPRVWRIDALAQSRFERAAEQFVQRTESAMQVQAALKQATDALITLRGSYEVLFPNLLHDAMKSLDRDPASFREARRRNELSLSIAQINQLLISFLKLKERIEAYPESTQISESAGLVLTGHELAALELAALDQRARLQSLAAGGATLSRLLRHTKSALAAKPKEAAPSTVGDSALLGELLGIASRTVAETESCGDELVLATALLGELSPARIDDVMLGLLGDSGPLSTGESKTANRGTTSNSRYILPITEDLVLVTPHRASTIRVWNATVDVGMTVAGVVSSDIVAVAPDLLEHDIATLFDGTRDEHSAWYSVKRRVKIEIVARRNDEWFGRVVSKGELESAGHSVWDTAPSGSAIRLMRPAPVIKPSVRLTDLPIVRVGGTPHIAGQSFLGMQTIEVNAPFAGHERVWMRCSEGPAIGHGSAQERVEREFSFFAELSRERATADLVPQPIGRGRSAQNAKAWPLYRILLAGTQVPLSGSGLAASYERMDAFRAMAQLLLLVHEAGYALNLVHPSMIAWRMTWDQRFGRIVRSAMLLHAPLATVADDSSSFKSELISSEMAPFNLKRIRISLGDVARSSRMKSRRDRDIEMLLVIGLELLASADLPAASGSIEELLLSADANGQAFVQPDVARNLTLLLHVKDMVAARDWLRDELVRYALAPTEIG